MNFWGPKRKRRQVKSFAVELFRLNKTQLLVTQNKDYSNLKVILLKSPNPTMLHQ
jgi:hypothetical protein